MILHPHIIHTFFQYFFVRLPYSARSWFVWDSIRHQSNSDKKLFLALEFASLASLREEELDEGLLAMQVEKWIAEPIKVLMPTNNTHTLS